MPYIEVYNEKLHLLHSDNMLYIEVYNEKLHLLHSDNMLYIEVYNEKLHLLHSDNMLYIEVYNEKLHLLHSDNIVWVEMVSRILFCAQIDFFAFLGPLGSRQSQNGGGTIFMPRDHLLNCIIPRWPAKNPSSSISLLIEVRFE